MAKQPISWLLIAGIVLYFGTQNVTSNPVDELSEVTKLTRYSSNVTSSKKDPIWYQAKALVAAAMGDSQELKKPEANSETTTNGYEDSVDEISSEASEFSSDSDGIIIKADPQRTYNEEKSKNNKNRLPLQNFDEMKPDEIFDTLDAISKEFNGRKKDKREKAKKYMGADSSSESDSLFEELRRSSEYSKNSDKINDDETKLKQSIIKILKDKYNLQSSDKQTRSERLKLLQDSVNTYLPQEYSTRLDEADFYDIDQLDLDCGSTTGEYLCPLAGYEASITASNLEAKFSRRSQVDAIKAVDIQQVVELYKNRGFSKAQSSPIYKSINDFEDAIKKRVTDASLLGEETYKFLFAYLQNKSVRVINAKAWLDKEGELRLLITDFGVSPIPDSVEHRFKTELDGKNFRFIDLNGSGSSSTPTSANSDSSESTGLFNSEQLQLAKLRLNGLSDRDKNRLKSFDFQDVKKTYNSSKGSWTHLAALEQKTLSILATDRRMAPIEDLSKVDSITEVVEAYKRVGYTDTRLVIEGNEQKLKNYFLRKLAPGYSSEFALAYTPYDSNHSGVYVLHARAWREKSTESGNKIEFLLTDFDEPPFSEKRFKRSLGSLVYARKYYLLVPLKIDQVDPASIRDGIKDLNSRDLEQGSGCKSKRIIGYMTSWSSSPVTLKQASKFTHLIYSFAEMKSNGQLNLPAGSVAEQRLKEAFVAKEGLKRRGADLKILFSIGGWSNSQHFSDALNNSDTRKKFISNIKSTLNKNRFDGVDIDWEYPGTGGATPGKAEDRANYIIFLSQLRRALGQNKTISIAAAAGESAMAGFDVARIVQYVDWINVMTYDYNGAWASLVGHNSPIYHSAPLGYSGKTNIDWTIKQYIQMAKDRSKIVLGLPFYGRFWHKTASGKNSVKYPAYRMAKSVKGKYGGEESYREIKAKWTNTQSGYKVGLDSKAQVPWALNPKTTTYLTYDNPDSIKAKVRYAIRKRLGGVMVWEIGHDDESLSLTNALSGMCKDGSSQLVAEIDSSVPEVSEVRWWAWTRNRTEAGQCGRSAPLIDGYYAHCDPKDPGFGCCSDFGFCGSGPEFCDCPNCVDYVKNPEKLRAQPIRPTSAKIRWHTGYSDKLKPGAPRCGPEAPKLNGSTAICDPDDDNAHCCSRDGFCGSDDSYCNCTGCKDYAKTPRD